MARQNFYVIYRPLRKGDYYSRVEAKNWADAHREIKDGTLGWFFYMYAEKDFLPLRDEWELEEIELTAEFRNGYL